MKQMRNGILGALLALSLVAGAGAEVVRSNATTFNPDGPKSNQLQDIPEARKLGGDSQAPKSASILNLSNGLSVYLEKVDLDTARHQASDFQAAQGTAISSPITPQAAFGGGGKKAVSPNKLNPINL